MSASKKYYGFRVTAYIHVRIPFRTMAKTLKDVQIVFVSENSQAAAGKKYVNIIDKSPLRTLDHIVKIEKIR